LKKYFSEQGHHNKGKKGIFSPQYGIRGNKIIMTSEIGKVMSFPSINSARKHFRVRFKTISENKNLNTPILIKSVK
jgi:hypothetical protein